ncbi:signal recognition particle-docking protein FtsY [Halomonas huangheensis]|uniref:Signal recognition particle receptor FtsY n=1 Tax=Halomonas huangheensis TaxID=1178482 RepID=W1N2K1_9GAMM|nr:signal recognition particle-docking protein FtsY [Halomonas huangheensis]ALM51303.1 signal recognition particle-docking protein FtsY [Halomonas huangheensis]ERL49733.1 hypothetical protein BJB45_01035 [Halomonas huangheensis]
MFGFLKRKKKPDDQEQTQSLLPDDALSEDGLSEKHGQADEAAVQETDAGTSEPEAVHSPEEQQVVEQAEPVAEPEESESAEGDAIPRDAEAPVVEEPEVEEPELQAEEPVTTDLEQGSVIIEPDAGSASAAPALQEKPTLQDKPRSEKKGWLARMRDGLGKTRANLSDGLADLFLGRKQIDEDLIEELETQLLMADVGIEATSEIIESLSDRVSRKELNDPDALYRALQQELGNILEPVSQPLELPASGEGPFVILVVGVNGVGKTTTIGKLTQRFQREGKSVMLAAGDTFRAAAVEQLKVWGERNSVPVVAQHTGADSASVIFDAVSAARARKVDVLIADTAGRLHNKSHLMEELKKVHRVMGKLDASAPHEVMLVLDAGTGQNALSQAATFNEAVPVTGITLTKLDGTAKGGIIFALAQQLKTPIRFIGVGESLDDLRPFVASEFVDALFDRRSGDADE